MTGELIDEYSYRYDQNSNIIEEIKREPYKKKTDIFDLDSIEENDQTIRVTKQTFTYDAENKLIDAKVERLGKKDLSEPSITTHHYEYDKNGNRTLVEIKDDNLTLESTVYTYDRLNRIIRSREVTRDGLYIYEYKYDANGNLIEENRHRQYETEPVFYQNIRRYEYTKDNKLEAVYSGNTLLVAYTYDGNGTITSSLDRDLDLNQNFNINDRYHYNQLSDAEKSIINKALPNELMLYELTEYVLDRNRPYVETLMQKDGAGNLSTLYTYGNQRINSESINNISGIYTYDGRGSVSSVIGGFGDYRATYWYDGLGNVIRNLYGAGDSNNRYKPYYGYNAEQYNPVTGNQNLRARQLNIRRQRFLTEDTYLGNKTDVLSINRYIYANDNPLRYTDPSGNFAPLVWVVISLGVGVIAGVATGVTTGDWEKGLKTGLVTAGATAVGIAAGAAAMAGATALGASALVTGVVGGAVGNGVRSLTRNTLGKAVLGENNSTEKIVKDFALDSLTGAIGGYGGSVVRSIASTGTKAIVQGAVGAVATGARDLTENAFFGDNKTNAEILSDMGFSFATQAGISYVGDTLINRMNAAKANSGLQGCEKAKVDYSESNAKPLNPNDSNAVYGNSKGWKVGDPVDAPTKNGNYPSWSTVKSRYWKNEAYNNPSGYSESNLNLMKQGMAPRDEVYNVPKEIHHINGRNIPNPHNKENLEPLWPWEHAEKDPHRFWKPPKE